MGSLHYVETVFCAKITKHTHIPSSRSQGCHCLTISPWIGGLGLSEALLVLEMLRPLSLAVQESVSLTFNSFRAESS